MQKIIVAIAILLINTISVRAETINKFNLNGNQKLSETELQQVLFPYLNRELSLNDILNARNDLIKYYQERGYFAVSIFIPKQEIKKGEIVVQINEGSIEKIEINGANKLSPEWIKSQISTNSINRIDLEKELQLLRNLPLIEDLKAELVPGNSLGNTILKLNLVEYPIKPWLIGTNNHASRVSGSLEGVLGWTDPSLTGKGDIAAARLGVTEGGTTIQGFYQRPTDRRGSTVEFGIAHTQKQVVEEPISVLDLQSSATSVYLGWRYPIKRDLQGEIYWQSALDWQKSRTLLDGQPFPFSNVSEDGRTEIWALRTGVSWSDRGQKSATFFNVDLSLGRGNGTQNFIKINNSIDRFQKLGSTTLKMSLSSQLGSNNLFPQEQFALGGISRGRGFRLNEFLGDSGIFGNLELKIPISDSLSVSPFLEAGRAWGPGFGDTIASTGISTDWQLNPNLRLKVDLAFPLTQTNGGDRLLFTIEQRL